MSPIDRPRSARGFTLVEVMVSALLSGMILAGVLSAFLMLGRSGYNAASYSIMEAESRRALEIFSQEARAAQNIVWSSTNSVTLTVVSSSGNYQVAYTYDPSTSGNSSKCFYRVLLSDPTRTKQILVRNVSDFAFRRYKVINGVDYVAYNDIETKQLQITLRSVRTGSTTVNATNAVLSARVVLRNKQVST